MAIIRIVYPHFVEDNMKDDMPARGKAIGQAHKINVTVLRIPRTYILSP